MTESLVHFREENSIGIVTLARPEKLNALTPGMLSELDALAGQIEKSRHLRAVILTAQGKAFCVGADINVWSSLEPLDMWRDWVRNGHRIFDRWAHLRLPVIAALNGHAFGGGLELAITADIRIATESTCFALPEASIATCPGWSGTQRLVKQIGPAMTKYLALTGRRIDAKNAMNIGLVQQVVSENSLLDEAITMATQIASLAPVSVQLTKQLIDAGHGDGTAACLESIAGALAATTQDAGEGLASFRERRQAAYKGA